MRLLSGILVLLLNPASGFLPFSHLWGYSNASICTEYEPRAPPENYTDHYNFSCPGPWRHVLRTVCACPVFLPREVCTTMERNVILYNDTHCVHTYLQTANYTG